jgi:glycosyltransferase involved in cell wall biosynthesis
MKVSIITVVFNGERYLEECIKSVLGQDYKNIEYLIIDGGSNDQTLSIIKKFSQELDYFISEPDKGMYDALNKGIRAATGDVVGILNADDILATEDVISSIVVAFEQNNADGVYGNLNYIDTSPFKKILRKWVSKQFVNRDISFGWMPAHPTLYLKKDLFNRFGNYSLDFGTAADYELMVRFLYVNRISAHFLNKLLVNMRIGGMSNSSLKQRYLAFVNDYKAVKRNKLPCPLTTVLLKKISKLQQFFILN